MFKQVIEMGEKEKRKDIFERIYDIFEDVRQRIRDAFEEVFESFDVEKPMFNLKEKCLEPLVDIQETEDDVIVTVDLPCVDKDAIKINATSDTLEIQATMKKSIKFNRWGTVQEEVEFQKFKKLIKLPSKVDPKRAQARFKQGILEIRLPKKVKKFRIEIK